MVEITYGEELKRHKELFELAKNASSLFELFLSPSGTPAKAHWDANVNGKTARIHLRISDPSGEVLWSFSPEELRNPEPTKRSLTQLWGDLLQLRSRKQLEELMAGEKSEA